MSRAMLRTRADVIFEQGIEKGENNLSNLINFLMHHGRTDDVLKVTSDPQVRKDMLVKFKSGELVEMYS